MNIAINVLFATSFILVVAITFLEYTRLMDNNPDIIRKVFATVKKIIPFGGENSYREVGLRNWMKVVFGAIAILIAITSNYVEKIALAQQAKRNFRMYKLFERARDCLTSALKNKDFDKADRILRDLGKEALIENGEWVMLFRERPIEVPK